MRICKTGYCFANLADRFWLKFTSTYRYKAMRFASRTRFITFSHGKTKFMVKESWFLFLSQFLTIKLMLILWNPYQGIWGKCEWTWKTMSMVYHYQNIQTKKLVACRRRANVGNGFRAFLENKYKECTTRGRIWVRAVKLGFDALGPHRNPKISDIICRDLTFHITVNNLF